MLLHQLNLRRSRRISRSQSRLTNQAHCPQYPLPHNHFKNHLNNRFLVLSLSQPFNRVIDQVGNPLPCQPSTGNLVHCRPFSMRWKINANLASPTVYPSKSDRSLAHVNPDISILVSATRCDVSPVHLVTPPRQGRPTARSVLQDFTRLQKEAHLVWYALLDTYLQAADRPRACPAIPATFRDPLQPLCANLCPRDTFLPFPAALASKSVTKGRTMESLRKRNVSAVLLAR